MEMWKDICGFAIYQISNLGNVRNKKTSKILKPQKSKGGYMTIKLYSNEEKKYYWKSIHRLVAQAFILNPNNKPCINHKDGIKTNNNICNLEWVTYSENTRHAFANNLQKSWCGTKFGENHPNYKFRGKWKTQKPVYKYDLNNVFIKRYNSATEVERMENISSAHIGECCKGRRKTVAGFIWKYESLAS